MPCWLPLLCSWWRQVVQHLAAAQEVAEAHQQKHACRAAFQVRLHLGRGASMCGAVGNVRAIPAASGMAAPWQAMSMLLCLTVGQNVVACPA